MKDEIVTTFKESWYLLIIILMLAGLVMHLSNALRVSRNNERELSKRLYEVGKFGSTNRVTQ